MQPPPAMDSDAEELLEAFQRATTELKLCPNRVWAVARENLPKLLPNRNIMFCAGSNGESHGKYSEENNHELCTFDFCEYSRRDFTAIQQRHECKDAKCIQLRGLFSRKLLEEASTKETSTVWNLAGDAMLEPPSPYMAISHVWSDGTGTGAWHDGEVNECLFSFFRDIAERFQCEGIWWDTLCIPREKAARNKAIQKIQNNYQDARVTLVHDCFLRNWEWNPETACFAILMSPWFSRGWTALELANSRKVKVIFKGRCGPVIKDLDEDILAKGTSCSGSRQEASRIIMNLRTEITSLNDLLTVIGPRYTSWPKDISIISALLVGIIPEELQQNTYRSILKKIGRLSPGNLFHNAATMSTEFTWCPTSLLEMPLANTSNTYLTISEDGIHGKWRIIHDVSSTLETNCVWNGTHPLIRQQLQRALKSPSRCRLLAECGNQPIGKALLVREIQKAVYQYVGPLYFRQELTTEFVEDVTISNEGLTPSIIESTKKEESNSTSKMDMLWRAVWRGDRIPGPELIGRAELDTPNRLGQRLLHLAAERGDKLLVRSFLDMCDLNARCRNGQTALHYACWGGSVDVVELLLEHNCKTTVKDKNGNTALHIAAQVGSEPVVRLLIDINAPVNTEGCNNFTPLHYATVNGHKDVVQLLLEKGANVDSEESRIGWRALHFAAGIGDEELVELLIGRGADVHRGDRNVGWTPLHFAAMNGHQAVVQLLVKHGASDKTKDKYGWTPRQFAGINGYLEAAKLLSSETKNDLFARKNQWTPIHCMAIDSHRALIKLLIGNADDIDFQPKDQSWSPLLFTVTKGFRAAIQRLLDKGASIETKDLKGRTLLSWAATEGHTTTVQLLLEKGASINAADKFGRTPLSYATIKGQRSVVELLLDNGANPEAVDALDQTPILLAVEKGHIAIIQLLLEKGVNIEARDTLGQTPLLLAAKRKYTAAMGLLLQKGASTDAEDRSNQTPLSWAARLDDAESGRLLLDHGTDIEIRNKSGQTPLILATRWKKNEMIEILLDKGADVNAADMSGWTALSWAVTNGQETVVQMILDKGANIETKDNFDRTPLLLAAEWGHKAIIEMLVDKGANIEAKDNKGRSFKSLTERVNKPTVST